jgi:hypothetical protein
MPRRKRRSPDDQRLREEEAWQIVLERYGYEIVAEAMKAENDTGRGGREFYEAANALRWGDEETFHRLVAVWLEPYINAEIGRRQRAAGKTSPGRRGKNRVAPEKLIASVQALHGQQPSWSFNRVCERVARAQGYKSAWSVKRAAAAVRWRTPRR